MFDKVKKGFYRHFFNNKFNCALLCTFIFIILIRLFFMYSNFIIDKLDNVFSTINGNELLMWIVTSFIPFVPVIFTFITSKIKSKNEKASQVLSSLKNKSRIFPNLIDIEKADRDIFSIKKNECRCDEIKDNEFIKLDRKNQCKNIIRFAEAIKSKKHKLNCLYLIGMNGSGKSTLLTFFLEEHFKKKCAIIYDKYYESDFIYDKLISGDYSVIIMDKFEQSFNNPGIYECIKKLVENSKKKLLFIFSFSQEYFENIHMKLNKTFRKDTTDIHSINFNTYFLQNDKHDIDQLKKIVVRFLGEEGNINECLRDCRTSFLKSRSFIPVIQNQSYSPSTVFLCSILSKIELGQSLLVEFSVMTNIYELFHEEIDSHIESYIDDTSKIIDLYLSSWLNQYFYPDTMMAILYLLSDKKNYTLDDIKYVSFEFEEDEIPDMEESQTAKVKILDRIITMLSENAFIKVKGDNGFNMTFSLAHDYLSAKIKEFCFKNLAIEIQQGVDNYRRIASDEQKYKDKKNKIKRRHENFQNKACRVFLNVIITIIIISTFLFTFLNKNKDDLEKNVTYMLLSINCLLSTHYIYNIVFYFFRMLDFLDYAFLVIYGFIFIELCFFYPILWGVFLGMGVVSLGVCVLFACKKVTNVAKKFLKHKGIAYVSFGIIIIAYGFLYYYDIISSIPTLILFVIYVGFSNVTHVKHEYMSRMINMANCI